MAICYLDANATTFMPDIVIKTMVKWTNKGNASANYESAKECKKLMDLFRNLLVTEHGFTNHTAIFTSGASESNSQIITSTVRSFMSKTGYMPHVITSNIEHKSIISCCEDLRDDGLCQYTKIEVINDGVNYGTVDPKDLEAAIKPNTCLISIMTANNETGIINNIPELSAIAHKHKIPFHTDCVQSFGKYGVYNGVDACSISFHKLHGPPGIGCLIINNKFINGYGLKPIIAGTQNFGLRGGTENIPGIGAAYAAYKYTYLRRGDKNSYVARIRDYLKDLLCRKINCFYIDEFESQKNTKNKIFWIANRDGSKILCNTLLFAVYKDKFCNIKMREELYKYGIIISIGSACNTSSEKSSGVIEALNVPKELRSGILRISLPDNVTEENINLFVDHFMKLIDVVRYN